MLYSSLLYLHHFRMLRLLLLLEFLHHLAIAVAEQALYQFIFQKPREVHLVPILLVPMPSGLYLGMVLTEFEGIVGMAFHRYPVWAFLVETSEYLAQDPKHQRGFVEGKILGHERQGEAILSNGFYVHNIWENIELTYHLTIQIYWP